MPASESATRAGSIRGASKKKKRGRAPDRRLVPEKLPRLSCGRLLADARLGRGRHERLALRAGDQPGVAEPGRARRDARDVLAVVAPRQVRPARPGRRAELTDRAARARIDDLAGERE